MEARLEFETAPFLHSLFANETSNLQYLQEKLGVKAVTREGWILLQGSPEAVETTRRAFQDLEAVKRDGVEIGSRDFRLAVDLAANGSNQRMSELTAMKLLGHRGRKPIVPRNSNQLHYLRLMQQHDLCFGLGPAGTGKTYLAVAMALAMLKSKQIRRIILTRPAVEAGEALGFLPGDMKEKVSPYLRPLYDAIHDMIGFEEGEKYLMDGTIEVAPLAFMRGRTLSEAFVILDEAQNTTCEQMFMVLTRLGEHSRMVVTGDASQVDLRPGIPSGLHEAVRALQDVTEVGFMKFNKKDVVRHPVVEKIIAAYERDRAGN